VETGTTDGFASVDVAHSTVHAGDAIARHCTVYSVVARPHQNRSGQVSILTIQEQERLTNYRNAVRHGFYNDGYQSQFYRGFEIRPTELRAQDRALGGTARWNVIQDNKVLSSVLSIHVARVWITCRLDSLTLKQAHEQVMAEQHADQPCTIKAHRTGYIA
jgi:hypothetical protein